MSPAKAYTLLSDLKLLQESQYGVLHLPDVGLSGITIVTFLLYFHTIVSLGALRASYVFYLIPLVGIIESAIIHPDAWNFGTRSDTVLRCLAMGVGMLTVLGAVRKLNLENAPPARTDSNGGTDGRARSGSNPPRSKLTAFPQRAQNDQGPPSVARIQQVEADGTGGDDDEQERLSPASDSTTSLQVGRRAFASSS